jgi:hypothetical protein
MRRVLIISALTAALALVAFTPAASTSPGGTYGSLPSSVKSAFVKGCIRGGGSRAACKCVIRKFERRYTLRQFLRIIDRVNETGEFSRRDERMIRACGRRYQ